MNVDVEVKQYDSFEEFAEAIQLLEYSDELNIDLRLMGIDGDFIEAHADKYLYVFACHATASIVSGYADRNNLKVVTYSIHDDDGKTHFVYENRMGFVNREGYMFCNINSQPSEHTETVDDNEYYELEINLDE